MGKRPNITIKALHVFVVDHLTRGIGEDDADGLLFRSSPQFVGIVILIAALGYLEDRRRLLVSELLIAFATRTNFAKLSFRK